MAIGPGFVTERDLIKIIESSGDEQLRQKLRQNKKGKNSLIDSLILANSSDSDDSDSDDMSILSLNLTNLTNQNDIVEAVNKLAESHNDIKSIITEAITNYFETDENRIKTEKYWDNNQFILIALMTIILFILFLFMKEKFEFEIPKPIVTLIVGAIAVLALKTIRRSNEQIELIEGTEPRQKMIKSSQESFNVTDIFSGSFLE